MEFCEDYTQCENLDGRLLITRTLDGPALSLDEDLAFGLFAAPQARLRPYARLTFEQKWIPKEMCYGPVRSVLGLAPCESITTEVRTVQNYEFTHLLQSATESSEVSTNTRSEGREFIDNNWDGNTVDLSKLTVGEWGSFWEVVGAVGGAILGGPIGAGIGAFAGGAIDDALNGGGGGTSSPTATGKVLSVVSETLESVQKSQSSSLLAETTTFKSSTRERSITRTFMNPYKNRTLELRFMPTFRHYQVVTYLKLFDFGLSLDVGNIHFPRTGLGVTHGDFLQARLTDQRIMSVANAELGLDDEISASVRKTPTSDHLNANSEIYTKKLLRHLHKQRDEDTLHAPIVSAIQRATKDEKKSDDLVKALSWSNSYAKDKSIYVPMSEPLMQIKRLGLSKKDEEIFINKVNKIKPEALHKIAITRNLHLFAGTHVEAVPGQCILPDLAVDCECADCHPSQDNGND